MMTRLNKLCKNNDNIYNKKKYLGKNLKLYTRMKISVITDISVLRFYRYIGDISADILEKNIGKLKIIKNSWKCKENLIII